MGLGREGAEIYRRILLTEGMAAREEPGRKKEGDLGGLGRGFQREDALVQLAEGGKLSGGELLRCRVRCFSEGIVLGSRAFMEESFQARYEWFGKKRKSGACDTPNSEGGFYSLRKLKGI